MFTHFIFFLDAKHQYSWYKKHINGVHSSQNSNISQYSKTPKYIEEDNKRTQLLDNISILLKDLENDLTVCISFGNNLSKDIYYQKIGENIIMSTVDCTPIWFD